MTTPVQTIIAKLQAANADAEFSAVKVELDAKVEANRAAGAGQARLMRENVLRNVHAAIKRLNPLVASVIKFEPCTFFVREPSKTYNDKWVQHSGWTDASFESKYAYLSFNFDVENSRYRANAGKNYLTFGSYGDRKRFKELKDGTWNYLAIAQEVIYRVEAGRVRIAREQRLERNKNAVAEVKAATGIADNAYKVAVVNTSNIDNPVNVKLSWSKEMTVAEAIALVNALKELGVTN